MKRKGTGNLKSGISLKVFVSRVNTECEGSFNLEVGRNY